MFFFEPHKNPHDVATRPNSQGHGGLADNRRAREPRKGVKYIDTDKLIAQGRQRRFQVLEDNRKQRRLDTLNQLRNRHLPQQAAEVDDEPMEGQSFAYDTEATDHHTEEQQRLQLAQEHWVGTIAAKNPAILDQPQAWDVNHWYLMPYDEILEDESQRVMETLQAWFPHGNTDLLALESIYTLEHIQHCHPLVKEFSWRIEHGMLALHFQLNPTYVKYLNPAGKKVALRIGGGIQTVASLNDYATDVLIEPQDLTINGTTTEVGKRMFARRLSQDHPVGMMANKDSRQDTLMGDLAKSSGSAKTQYIKGHLLNDNLGGPARTENLFPITMQANSDHISWVEKYVKAEVAAGYVMEYCVDVENVVTSPAAIVGTTRNGFTVNATLKCHTAKLDLAGKPLTPYNLTITSQWGAAVDPLLDHTTAVNDPSSLQVLKDKLHSGTPNKGKHNPDVNPPTFGTHLSHTQLGYNQGVMALGDHSGVTTVSHNGVLPFNFPGNTPAISSASQADLALIIGPHKASLVYPVVAAKGNAVTKADILAVKGIGPATLKQLEKSFSIN